MRRSLPLGVLTAAAALAGCAGAGLTPDSSSKPVEKIGIPSNGWPSEKQATHVLNRLGYGPLPGEVEAVAKSGVAAWIRGQMAPARLDDAATDAKLRGLPTVSMTIPTLFREFPRPRDAVEKPEPGPPKKRTAMIEQQLAAAKLVRAVESRRQLQEVLVDFWFNHFNVFAGKGQDRWLVGSYERDAIRPRVFGRFRDLLGATAAHPAMLFYLDNWVSSREGTGGNPGSGFPRRGLNENYARELLELHTLGVDGGYTEADVREVARCFTGWSLVPPRAAGAPSPRGAARDSEPGTFVFRPRAHDSGEKRVLGAAIPAGGGREDGEKVLDLVARHPATARFVATKLCRRFVSDDPPAGLVARAAAVFTRTDGDLRSVYAVIFFSPEFWSDEAWRAKMKTPLELAASAVRATGGAVDLEAAAPLVRQVALMGEPLFRCAPPTGYPDVAAEWTSAGMLVNRIAFGVALASGRVPGVRVDATRFAPGVPDPSRAAALVLAGPEFQRR